MIKGERNGAKYRRNQAQASRCPFPVKLHRDALNFFNDKMLQTRETPLSLGVQGFLGGQSREYAQLLNLQHPQRSNQGLQACKIIHHSSHCQHKLSGQTDIVWPKDWHTNPLYQQGIPRARRISQEPVKCQSLRSLRCAVFPN